MKKIGIKKTWGNIIMLFVIGMVIGIVIGLRQPMPSKAPSAAQTAQVGQTVDQNGREAVQNTAANQETASVDVKMPAAVSDTAEKPAASACDGAEPTCEIPVNKE